LSLSTKGEADVVFKGFIAAATAVAMSASAAIAAPAQTVKAAAQIAPAEETVEGSELRGGFIIPLLAIIAIILGILAALGELDGDDNGPRRSPG
jgi:hypothetical protein